MKADQIIMWAKEMSAALSQKFPNHFDWQRQI